MNQFSNFKILAIETSCDETAAAVIKVEGTTRDLKVNILSNIVSSQIDIHKKFGGVFPEYASRAHTERILPVVESAILQAEEMSSSEMPVSRTKSETRLDRAAESERISRGFLKNVDLVAVTVGPGLIGSLLVGVNFAKTYAFAHNLPIIEVNHLAGHLYSNWAEKPFPQFPAIVLIVSGGHTGLYLMKSHTDIETLGETLDDAAGEAFDKVAKLLQLGYPGGPAISAEAEKFKIDNSQFIKKVEGIYPNEVAVDREKRGNRLDRVPESEGISQGLQIKFPRSMLDRKDYNFSFSGLKTAVLYKVQELSKTYHLKPETYTAAIAYEFQQAVIDILIGKTLQAASEFKPKSICLCGGVSANKELRDQMAQAVNRLPYHPSFHIPSFSLTTDNAAMIGITAAYQIVHRQPTTDYRQINANANFKLD